MWVWQGSLPSRGIRAGIALFEKIKFCYLIASVKSDFNTDMIATQGCSAIEEVKQDQQ